MPHSHTRLAYCASLVRLLRCNFWIKGRVIFSQSARLSFLIVVQAPFAQVWALRAVIALVGLRRQTFVLVLMWTSGFPSLYIFMYTFCQSLIGYSRHSQCEKSVRCGRLGKPSIKHRGVSREFSVSLWHQKETRFCGRRPTVSIGSQGKFVSMLL